MRSSLFEVSRDGKRESGNSIDSSFGRLRPFNFRILLGSQGSLKGVQIDSGAVWGGSVVLNRACVQFWTHLGSS